MADITMDPLSAGVGALSSIVGAWQQNKAIKKSIAAQKEENEKTRNYNLMLARMQNAWNIEQWERENAFNDPSQIRNRLKNAGMNVDLAYSGAPASLVSAASPAMTSGAPASSADMSGLALTSNAGSITTQALQNAMVAANIKNIKANTAKTNEEIKSVNLTNDILSSDAKFREAMNQTHLESEQTSITLNKTLKELYGANTEKARQETSNLVAAGDKLVAETNKLRQETANLSEDQKLKQIEQFQKKEQFDLICRDLQASINQKNSAAHLSYAEAKACMITAAAQAAGVDVQIN